MKFILDTNWIFQDPIDYEHKQYVLLAYFQKMADNFNRFELYPYFIEISLHLANIQTISKENLIVTTEKKFKSNDDELLITDLNFRELPQLNSEQEEELKKIIVFSAPKFQDYFNIAKSVWTLVYESTHVSIKKNKKNLYNQNGYFYYIINNDFYLWEYELTKSNKNSYETKSEARLVTKQKIKDENINEILTINIPRGTKTNPIFECVSNEDFPIEETLLPIFKRKIISYILQSGIVETYKKYV